MSSQATELFGCDFDPVTMQGAVAQCGEWCKGERASHIVLTVNAALICMKRRDPELARACDAADFVVPDGVSVVWASRLAGEGLVERIAGVDLTVELLRMAAQNGHSVYFLGAKPEVLSEFVERCHREYPTLQIAGFRDGYFKESDHAAIVEQIRESGAHILFIGMPSPFKETWAQRHRERLNVPVIIGVGGTFDVLAGKVKRAPRWLQAAGMEWSWRLAMEPRRMWKRYLLTNSEFLWLTARLVASRRLGKD